MPQAQVTRRLAAIVAADMVGYSTLMERDEDGTIARQKAHREAIFAPEVAQHHGRIVKTTGDGLLIEFASVTDAVRCAVEIQRRVAAHEAAAPEDRRIAYRFGVNLGDIVVDGEDILGEGVNIAARLEALAAPGGINLSGEVFRHIEGKIDAAFEAVGEHTVKNIQRPVQIYRLKGAGDRPAAGRAAAAPPALPDKPSIAVLPFENLSGDVAKEYFADGLTEDIITELARFRDLFVIARNSTFVYKGRHVKAQEVAAELGVRYMLEGSVQWAGEQIRITAQLIDALSGEHVWAGRYDRQAADVFSVRDEVTEDIAAHLGGYHGAVIKAEKRRSRRQDPAGMRAYERYLYGIELKHRFQKDSNLEARRVLEEVIALDPEFARAYTALAWTWLFELWWGWTDSADRSLAEAARLAEQSVTLDDLDAEVHWLLAEIALVQREFERVEFEYARALELNPNMADVLAVWGGAANRLGRHDEAVAAVKKAMRLNPSYPEFYSGILGAAFYGAKRYDEAIAALRRLMHHTRITRLYLAASLAQAGRAEEAGAELAKAREIDPHATLASITAIEYYRDADDRAHFEDGLRKAGLA